MSGKALPSLSLSEIPKGSSLGVSACLLGVRCRYDGSTASQDMLDRLLSLQGSYVLIPVCPEQLGGLTTPRPPAERVGDRVITREGNEVTAAFVRGAQETLALFNRLGVKAAILKEGSPSCGSCRIYDGTFSGVRIQGEGVTTRLLRSHGCEVYSEADVPEASF